MMFETMVTMVGKVVGEITQRTVRGDAVAAFRMMAKERRYDRDAGRWVDGDRMFLTVHCWRALAESVVTSLAKGDPVLVIGRLHHREYVSDGQPRLNVELEARAIGPDLVRCTASIIRAGKQQELIAA